MKLRYRIPLISIGVGWGFMANRIGGWFRTLTIIVAVVGLSFVFLIAIAAYLASNEGEDGER